MSIEDGYLCNLLSRLNPTRFFIEILEESLKNFYKTGILSLFYEKYV